MALLRWRMLVAGFQDQVLITVCIISIELLHSLSRFPWWWKQKHLWNPEVLFHTGIADRQEEFIAFSRCESSYISSTWPLWSMWWQFYLSSSVILDTMCQNIHSTYYSEADSLRFTLFTVLVCITWGAENTLEFAPYVLSLCAIPSIGDCFSYVTWWYMCIFKCWKENFILLFYFILVLCYFMLQLENVCEDHWLTYCYNCRHENFSGDISSRMLREVSKNLLTTNCLIPSMLDRLASYVVKNGDHILGDTVVRLLYLCYCLGYTPTQAISFFSVASSIILR